jgi:hypothetical protein
MEGEDSMRSLALTALLGSFVASSGLVAQSLTEHAAAAAGVTIGTAAGKPLGTSLGKVFGVVDKSTSAATTPKTAKPVVIKPAAASPPVSTAHAPVGPPSVGAGDGSTGAGRASSHRSAPRRERAVEAEAVASAPITPVMPPVVAEVVIKEPTVEDVASIKVGATASQLRAALGVPESRISIPGDDGHLLEICQYWAKGEPVGTIRLDNGHVVSVQAQN